MAVQKPEYGIDLPQAMSERGELLEDLIDLAADLERPEDERDRARRWAVRLEQEQAETQRLLAALVASFEPDASAVQFTSALGAARDYLGRPEPTRTRPGMEVTADGHDQD